MKNKTELFTFGQVHQHTYKGETLDKNTIVRITAENPREVMFSLFGDVWCWQYNEDYLDELLESYPKEVKIVDIKIKPQKKGGKTK